MSGIFFLKPATNRQNIIPRETLWTRGTFWEYSQKIVVLSVKISHPVARYKHIHPTGGEITFIIFSFLALSLLRRPESRFHLFDLRTRNTDQRFSFFPNIVPSSFFATKVGKTKIRFCIVPKKYFFLFPLILFLINRPAINIEIYPACRIE